MWEKTARQIVEMQRKLAPMMAQQMMPGPGAVKYNGDDERRAFWQRASGVDEQQLWNEALLAGEAEDMDYDEIIARAAPRIAMVMYPARAGLIRQGARKLSVNEQIAFTRRMERLGPPEETDGI